MDDELGDWTMWSRPADPRLSAWATPIRGYRQRRPLPSRHVTTATALLPLVIPFGSEHRVTDADGHVTQVGAFLAGSHDALGVVEADGFAGLQVDLTPTAAHRILGGGVHELVGRTVALDDLLGPDARRLCEQLGSADDWATRLAVLEGFLLDRWARGPDVDDTTAAVWHCLAAGTTRVDDLADTVGWSPRQLRRRTRTSLGLTPKRLARVVRFHRTRQRLEQDATTPLVSVAAQHGYSDQAHMTREFVELAGTTPAALRRMRSPRVDTDANLVRPR